MRVRKLRCSFCRKSEDQVSKLVARPRSIVARRLYICNECVAAAISIMHAKPPPAPAVSHSPLQKMKTRWRRLLQRSPWRDTSAAKAP
jgi:ATP-dependent protease Clp ATPase subunit